MSKRQLNSFFARVGARSLVSKKTGADIDMRREGDLLVFECKADGWRFDFELATGGETEEQKAPRRARAPQDDKAEDD